MDRRTAFWLNAAFAVLGLVVFMSYGNVLNLLVGGVNAWFAYRLKSYA